MSHSINRSDVGTEFDEFRVVTRTVTGLALVTAVLYIRAILQGGFFARNAANPTSAAPLMVILLALGIIGLLLAWRWESTGGCLAVLSAASMVLYLNATLLDGKLLATFVYSSPFLVAGFLCLADRWLHRAR